LSAAFTFEANEIHIIIGVAARKHQKGIQRPTCRSTPLTLIVMGPTAAMALT
jgi:hypothetical protein